MRKALNLAVDRDRLIEQGLLGYANPMPAMTPSWCSGFPAGATPYPHDPAEARRLFEKGGWPAGRAIRIATPAPFAGIAQFIASDLRRALDVAVEVTVMPDDQALSGVRALVEKKLELPWDLLVHAWFDLSSEAPPAAVHREFFGKDGAFRAGPPDEDSTHCSRGWPSNSTGPSWCVSPSRSTSTASSRPSRCSCVRRRRFTR